eukprot:2974334-Amphidinium_carterae.1
MRCLKGEFADGFAHGSGQLITKSGTIYKGEWVNNLAHGDGTYKSPLDSGTNYRCAPRACTVCPDPTTLGLQCVAGASSQEASGMALDRRFGPTGSSTRRHSAFMQSPVLARSACNSR